MTKPFPNIGRARQFSKGDYLIHVSGVVGIATGEVIYEPRNPLEKTKIILNSGFPLVDYCIKFCPATERERQIFIEGNIPEEIVEHKGFRLSFKFSSFKE
jgi:hypothetical protein